jgi:cytochrome b subunit of formate dehydrogenase
VATGTDRIERYGRRARWLHAAVYLPTIPLLATGLWLLGGQEGHPSILSRVTGVADTGLHIWLGWALTVVVAFGVVAGVRAIPTFLRETVRHDRGDGRWFIRWPKAVFTGRFARHEGKWDPGQRIANLVIVVGLLVLIVTGIGLATLHGGHVFAMFAKVHKWTAIVITLVLIGHIVIAAGVLPGYKGVWRSMHLGGRLRVDTARRVWPGWAEDAPRGSSLEVEKQAPTKRTSVDR